MPIMARLVENDKANKMLISLIIIGRYANGRHLREDLRAELLFSGQEIGPSDV